jgi:AAHS family benzoate transporter-like MFS transporter
MDRPNVTKFCDELKFNRFHWAILVLGGLTLVFDGYDGSILPFVIPHIIKEWDLTPVTAGSIVSYGLIGLMVGTAGLGMLGDRIGRKIPLMLGLVIFSAFSGGLYWVHDFKTFCLLRFLAGIGMGGALTLNITLTSEFAPARTRGRMVAAMATGFMVGPLVAGVIAMLFVPSYGWRIVLLFGLFPLIFLPFLYWFLPESFRFLIRKGRYDRAVDVLRRMERAARVAPIKWTKESLVLPAQEKRASVKQLFGSKLAVMTILVWLTYFFCLLTNYGITTWLPTLLYKAGYSLVRSYAYTVVGIAGAIVGSIFLGMVLDRFGRKWGLGSAFVLAAIVLWLFGRAVGSSVLLCTLAFAQGIFFGGGQTNLHTVTGEIYPTFMRSTGVGWALTMGRFGGVCGPVVGGLIQSAGFSFSQYFAFIAVLPLICAILVFFYRVNVKGEGLETVEAELTGAGA